MHSHLLLRDLVCEDFPDVRVGRKRASRKRRWLDDRRHRARAARKQDRVRRGDESAVEQASIAACCEQARGQAAACAGQHRAVEEEEKPKEKKKRKESSLAFLRVSFFFLLPSFGAREKNEFERLCSFTKLVGLHFKGRESPPLPSALLCFFLSHRLLAHRDRPHLSARYQVFKGRKKQSWTKNNNKKSSTDGRRLWPRPEEQAAQVRPPCGPLRPGEARQEQRCG